MGIEKGLTKDSQEILKVPGAVSINGLQRKTLQTLDEFSRDADILLFNDLDETTEISPVVIVNDSSIASEELLRQLSPKAQVLFLTTVLRDYEQGITDPRILQQGLGRLTWDEFWQLLPLEMEPNKLRAFFTDNGPLYEYEEYKIVTVDDESGTSHVILDQDDKAIYIIYGTGIGDETLYEKVFSEKLNSYVWKETEPKRKLPSGK